MCGAPEDVLPTTAGRAAPLAESAQDFWYHSIGRQKNSPRTVTCDRIPTAKTCHHFRILSTSRTWPGNSFMANQSPFVDVDRTDLVKPSQAIADFVQRLSNRSFTGVEHRTHRRHLMALPILVQPVDQEFQPQGAPYKVVLHDISTGGAGLLHTRAIKDRFLALELRNSQGTDAETVHLVMEVLRCRSAGPMYDIGGRFITRLDPLNSSPNTVPSIAKTGSDAE